jgi:hypothetical protein
VQPERRRKRCRESPTVVVPELPDTRSVGVEILRCDVALGPPWLELKPTLQPALAYCGLLLAVNYNTIVFIQHIS